MSHITFLGGAGTVTGSKYLIEAAGRRILLVPEHRERIELEP